MRRFYVRTGCVLIATSRFRAEIRHTPRLSLSPPSPLIITYRLLRSRVPRIIAYLDFIGRARTETRFKFYVDTRLMIVRET